jgi:hypothetical protein
MMRKSGMWLHKKIKRVYDEKVRNVVERKQGQGLSLVLAR